MRVRDLTSGIISCPPTATLHEAAVMMKDRDVGALLVMDDDTLRGIVSERDVVRAAAAAADLAVERVVDWMTGDVGTIRADVEVDEAAAWILGAGYRHLPVVDDDDEVVGVVSIKDVLFALYEPEG